MHAANDDDILTFAEAADWQERVCAKAGAPASAALLAALARAHVDGLISRDIGLASHVRFGDFIPLRLLAAIHALALQRKAPMLALHMPTLGERFVAGAEVSASVVADALGSDPALVNDYLQRMPQTNEVSRAHPLRIALAHLGTQHPVHLREIGCSAGLLLNADRLEPMPGEVVRELPRIASRVGFDIKPVDVNSVEGRLRLSSYIWPDHVGRFRRLGDAIVTAQHFPPQVRTMDAVSAIETLALGANTTTLVWHSALWPYMSSDERTRLNDAVDTVGATVTGGTRFAVASWEVASHAQARRLHFTLAMRVWSDGEVTDHILATGNSHGTEVFETAND